MPCPRTQYDPPIMYSMYTTCCLHTYLEVVDGDPRILGEALYVGHQELNAAIPVSQEKYCQHKVADACKCQGSSGIEQLWREQRI